MAMTSAVPRVFVGSATGAQGSALCRQLRSIGWEVHATVRNPDAPVADALKGAGVKLFVGDWENKEVLAAGLAGCDKLFLNLVPTFQDWDHERVQAQIILAIAKAAGIKQVVYSSIITADAPEKRGGDNPASAINRLCFSKNTIEGLVQRAGFDHWTILRGGFFMANFLQPKVLMMYPNVVKASTFKTALTADTPINMVDHEDLARFAVAAFQDPARFNQHGIEVASEALTPVQMMQQLSLAVGREFKAEFYTDDEVKEQIATNPLIEAQIAMRTTYRLVDMNKIRSWEVPLTTFGEFLVREKDALKATYDQ